MNHMYISSTLDEKVVVADAIKKSKIYGPYEVHYHPEVTFCEAKFRHRIFADGHEHVASAGPQ